MCKELPTPGAQDGPETPRRAEATVFRSSPSLKEDKVDLGFCEGLYDSLTLVDKFHYARR
jgi:hypothetical protein